MKEGAATQGMRVKDAERYEALAAEVVAEAKGAADFGSVVMRWPGESEVLANVYYVPAGNPGQVLALHREAEKIKERWDIHKGKDATKFRQYQLVREPTRLLVERHPGTSRRLDIDRDEMIRRLKIAGIRKAVPKNITHFAVHHETGPDRKIAMTYDGRKAERKGLRRTLIVLAKAEKTPPIQFRMKPSGTGPNAMQVFVKIGKDRYVARHRSR